MQILCGLQLQLANQNCIYAGTSSRTRGVNNDQGIRVHDSLAETHLATSKEVRSAQTDKLNLKCSTGISVELSISVKQDKMGIFIQLCLNETPISVNQLVGRCLTDQGQVIWHERGWRMAYRPLLSNVPTWKSAGGDNPSP